MQSAADTACTRPSLPGHHGSVKAFRLRALVAPRDQLLPGLGARLERRPRVASHVLLLLRRAPGRRLRTATLRNLTLPLVERMRGPLIVPVAGGTRMLVSMADIEGRMLATSGLWEPQTLALLRQMLEPGDVFVDLGANIGFFSLFASKLVGPTGRVYAVEPAPETYRALVENLERNGVANVVAKQVAAGAVRGEAVLRDVRGQYLRGAASIMRGPEEFTDETAWPPVTVSVAPVTQIVDSGDLGRVRLIKIDVEGAEVDVLTGLEDVFVDGPPRPSLAVEVHTQIVPEAPDFIAEFCRRHGLNAYRIGDALTDDRDASAKHLNAAALTSEELAQTRDDYFYVVLTDDSLPASARLSVLAAKAARAVTSST